MNWLNHKRQTADTFLSYLCAPWKVATRIAVVMSLLTATSAWSQSVPGSLDVHWNEGASDCKTTPQAPLQVHAYEPQTFILRQNPCVSFEGNFLYLLIGSDKALLIDTGAVAGSKEMPLAKTVLELLPEKDHKKLPLLVAHTHRHMDHRAGDPQFASVPSVEVVPIDLEGVKAFYRFADWPNEIAHLDLGGRTVDVIPTPGHNATHVAFYDNRTGVLFSGDFLLPGRLLIEDASAYRESALRVIDFLKTRSLTHILGAHVELNTEGHAYRFGSHYHPNEHRLELAGEDLTALPAAFENFNGFYARHPNYILTNPNRNLVALAIIAVAILIFIVWALRRSLRHRRRQRA
jgi:hydroxyacylglutathione hydrolase